MEKEKKKQVKKASKVNKKEIIITVVVLLGAVAMEQSAIDANCRWENFADLYVKEWSNALCEERKELDILGVGAYDNGKLVGLAGCSADCDTMWQIDIDVLPEYRRKGIASALTSRLAIEVLNVGKVPFYCCAWSNVKSARNAIKSGFRPAWVELTVKSAEYGE